MRVVWVALYFAGWAATTFVMLRGTFAGDETGRRQRAVMSLVSVGCAIALAAVWPISGWFLPFIRSALEGRD